MSRPLVSICLPNLNSRRFLDERMESILSQTVSDWELIVCDSHSHDGSWEFFQKFSADPRIKLFRVPREGLYAGWNECLRRVSGSYVHMAPADDTSSPCFLERLAGALDKHPDVHLAVCQFDFVDSEGSIVSDEPGRRFDLLYHESVNVPHRRPREADILTHFCVGIPWMTASAMVFRSSLLARTGLFRTDCASRADGLWSLRASLFSDSIALPERLATWRRHAEQGSARYDKAWWKRNWQLAAGEMDAFSDRIPASWKRDPEWRKELLRVLRTRYLRGLDVDRRTAGRSIFRFLGCCVRGIFCEPRFVVRRLMSGLAWEDPELIDEYSHLQYLIRKWNVRWQPEVLADYDKQAQL